MSFKGGVVVVVVFLFDTPSLVAQTGLVFAKQLKMTLNFQSLCLYFPRTGITGIYHHNQSILVFGILSGVICLLGKPLPTEPLSPPFPLLTSPCRQGLREVTVLGYVDDAPWAPPEHTWAHSSA